jgi:hypothetical protein
MTTLLENIRVIDLTTVVFGLMPRRCWRTWART